MDAPRFFERAAARFAPALFTDALASTSMAVGPYVGERPASAHPRAPPRRPFAPAVPGVSSRARGERQSEGGVRTFFFFAAGFFLAGAFFFSAFFGVAALPPFFGAAFLVAAARAFVAAFLLAFRD